MIQDPEPPTANTAEAIVRQADAAYRSFPTFTQWAMASLDSERWNREIASFEGLRGTDRELLAASVEIMTRAAAVDTGALEGLYETDRGFTFAVATAAAYWQEVAGRKGPRVVAHISDQLNAYERVVDLATSNVAIAEAWIRQLHAEVCRSQETYEVRTRVGVQHQSLPKGEYKRASNHVERADGTLHAHAPVDLTAAEMHRLCEELRGDPFRSAHPVLQASYAHYALVVVHPFSDGNGRVARALASVFTCRALSLPLMILVDHRRSYLSSLQAADRADFRSFTQFVMDRILETCHLISDGLEVARGGGLQHAAAELRNLYRTRGGYTHLDVERAGYVAWSLFEQELRRRVTEWNFEEILPALGQRDSDVPARDDGYRLPTARGIPQLLQLTLRTKAPAVAEVSLAFQVEIPKDAAPDSTILIRDVKGDFVFTAPIKDVLPEPNGGLGLRVTLAVEKALMHAVQALTARARKSLGEQGFV